MLKERNLQKVGSRRILAQLVWIQMEVILQMYRPLGVPSPGPPPLHASRLAQALHKAKPTGYDMHGLLCAKLSAGDRKKIFKARAAKAAEAAEAMA